MKASVPFLLQGLLMTVDEFYCHRRRELRRWERIGHPIDTFVFTLCFMALLFVDGAYAAPVFAVLAVASCVTITKDEWQHRELCSGFENWLHAMLFMIHPVVLIWAYWLWSRHEPGFEQVLGFVTLGCSLFFLYQLVYWNVFRALPPVTGSASQSRSNRS